MIIEIPDEIRDKLTYAKIEILKHLLSIHRNHVHAAKHMGVCLRVLNNWFRKYPELDKYRNKKEFLLKQEGNEKWDMYPDK